MRKTAKRNDKHPTKTKKIRKKTLKPRTWQASKVKVEISSMKMNVTGKLQRKLTIKGPSIDPGTRVEILEV